MKNIPYAHNPILPADTFVPDVEAHVWEDGRLYLYGSFDLEGATSYCSDCYHVYSTDNLVDWRDHGVAFTLDDLSWLEEGETVRALYAPDCAYRNGYYYLYYCTNDKRCGVARSEHPWGPFSDLGQIQNVYGIDPAVLIDDDGQAYLYWGQFDGVRAARLKENMVEIEPESMVQPLSVARHEFHEGSSVKKINGKYYYLFTDTHRHAELNNGLGMATCMGYAVSDHPMTGFEYRGIMIDNFGCDPQTWNNHGSMMCFRGQWYIFYHRSTHGSKFSRHVCIEPIAFDADGNIAELTMTSSGAGGAIPADAWIPAHLACLLWGHVRIAPDNRSAHHLVLDEIHPGDTADYRYIDFENEAGVAVSLCADGDFAVEVLIDDVPYGTLRGPASEEFVIHRVQGPCISGRHRITLRFGGAFTSAVLDELTFEKNL